MADGGQTDAFDPYVWTGRALQAEFEKWRGLVLRICIRPLHGAFVLLAIMDIRSRPIKCRVFLPVSIPMVCATVAAVLWDKAMRSSCF